jgi:hypothetical protein
MAKKPPAALFQIGCAGSQKFIPVFVTGHGLVLWFLSHKTPLKSDKIKALIERMNKIFKSKH